MPSRERKPSQGVGRKEHWLWLRSDKPTRSRPWAYEELLLGSSRERQQARELDAVVEELQMERAELARLYQELDDHFARIASLERELKELTPTRARDEPRPVSAESFPHTRAAPAVRDDSGASLAHRSYALARCEGFEVGSPSGPVGVVEGFRFISRIDQPDLLEVRGGRFGRQLLLIPIEQVEEIRLTEERLVLRSAPTLTGDLLGEIVDRLRRALRFDQAAS
jgi:hypothetical protein